MKPIHLQALLLVVIAILLGIIIWDRPAGRPGPPGPAGPPGAAGPAGIRINATMKDGVWLWYTQGGDASRGGPNCILDVKDGVATMSCGGSK